MSSVYMTWCYSYIHYVVLNDNMMKVFEMNEVVFNYLLIYDSDGKACGLIIGLLSMWETIGLHMYIALVDLDWEYE